MSEKRRGWSQKEIQFIKDNYGTLSLHQISSRLSRSYDSVTHKIHRLQLDDPRCWTEDENKILVENYEHNPRVWDLFPTRSYHAVKQRASKTFKLQRDTGNCPVNHRFFDVINRDSAYVLGFFTADGCVERKSGVGARISFSQRLEDIDVLYAIRSVMESESPISIKRGRNEAVLYIHNGRLVAMLHAMGFDSSKTSTATIPDCISDKLMPDYIRGLLDGDGSIITAQGRFRIQLLGTYPVLRRVREFLIRHGVSSRPSVNKRRNVNVHCLSYSKQADVYDICNLIYSGSNIHMARKYRKAMEVLSVLDGAFARGETPRIINPAQIGETLLGSAKGNPEGKTSYV